MKLDEFIRTRITEPLGMQDTQFFLSPAQRERLAAVYASDGNGKVVRAPEAAKGQGEWRFLKGNLVGRSTVFQTQLDTSYIPVGRNLFRLPRRMSG